MILNTLTIIYLTCLVINLFLMGLAYSSDGLQQAFEKAKEVTPEDKRHQIPSPLMFSFIFVLLGPISLVLALAGIKK